jgi:hypothetical protein
LANKITRGFLTKEGLWEIETHLCVNTELMDIAIKQTCTSWWQEVTCLSSLHDPWLVSAHNQQLGIRLLFIKLRTQILLKKHCNSYSLVFQAATTNENIKRNNIAFRSYNARFIEQLTDSKLQIIIYILLVIFIPSHLREASLVHPNLMSWPKRIMVGLRRAEKLKL